MNETRNEKQGSNAIRTATGNQQIANSRDCDGMKIACNPEVVSTMSANHSGNRKDVPERVLFGKQFDTKCDEIPPCRPVRRRSSSYLEGVEVRVKVNGEEPEEDQNEGEDEADVLCATTLDPTCSTAPCSSVYCNTFSEITRKGTTGSSRSILTEDTIRAFLHDYYEDYDAMRGPQTLDAWYCFAEKYYCSDFQFVRPSGNPIKVDGLVEGLSSDMSIKSMELISIDSITIFSSSTSAVAIYTCDHFFEYKGIPAESRGVMTCVMDLVRGELKLVHEHRSSGRPIPKETRWEPE